MTLPLFSWSASARAEDEAVTRFERGVQLYESENYEGALVEFNTAYRLSKNYKLLYNVGICQTATKDYAAATATFERYLSEGGADVTDAKRADVQDRLAKLSLNVTHLRVTTNAPAGSTLTVDGHAVRTVPLPETITVNLGRRQLSISADGRTVSRTVNLSSGDQNAPVNLQLEPVPTAVVAPTMGSKPAPEAGPSFPYVWWGLTAAVGAGAAVTGILAVQKRNDFEETQATFGVTKKSLEDDRASARTLGYVTDGLLAGTVVMAGLSTYFTIRYFKQKKQHTTGFYVTPLPGLVGAGYTRSF